jgi:hypothetical protein
MLDFLQLPRRRGEITLAGSKNPNPRPTVVGDADRQQFAAVVAALPASYLQIFERPPYSGWPWIAELFSTAPLSQPRVQ